LVKNVRPRVHTSLVSHSAVPLDRDRLKRIVRFMMAHVADETISSRDADNVFDLVGAKPAERDAVLRALPQMGMRVTAEVPVSYPGTGDVIEFEVSPPLDPVPPVTRNAEREDIEAARRVLRSDRGSRNPSKRVLTAREEVGLAFLIRGSGIPLDAELPRGYRGELEPADERAQAFDTFIVHNIRLVWSVARAQHAGLLELEDVVQHGILGLCRAVEKFDATQGNKFSTYAMWWIRQSIGRGIADDGRLIRIPVHIFEQVNKVRTARNRILEKTGTCGLSRLASETGLPAERVVECLRLAAGVVSLDKPIDGDGDGDSLADFVLAIPANEADPAQLIDGMTLRRLIRDALSDLTEREAVIIRLREGLDDDMPRTLDQVGKVLGLTRERIRQIEGKAHVKLRRAFIKRGLRPMRPVPAAPADDKPHDDAQAVAESENLQALPGHQDR
jgi:RNA polymerase primary sigma factor